MAVSMRLRSAKLLLEASADKLSLPTPIITRVSSKPAMRVSISVKPCTPFWILLA